jgi:hypothetical protein
MESVWSTRVEMHCMSSLAWYWILTTQVETHFVSLLAWEEVLSTNVECPGTCLDIFL